MSLDAKQWSEVKRVWQADKREGYAWLVREMGLSVSAQAVRYQAIRNRWAKRAASGADSVMDALYGTPVEGEGDFRPGFVVAAGDLAKLGVGKAEMAEAFGVPLETLIAWEGAHPKFRDALLSGGMLADARVAEQLYRCATGFSYQTEEVVTIGDQVKAVSVVITVPPDPASAMFWLQNSHLHGLRGHTTQDKAEEGGGSNG